MLQIRNVCKEYKTGKLIQKALDDFSLNLRDNEFVAVLGPSGSGKTTLLNIIGGLDRCDSGELIINGISTKKYKDRDWDSYRNHTVGFVFQNYNLIPHQSVLSNVELALTISGIGRRERRQRALNALEKVGLGDQVNKKPNQLSGGQMQRVAIARALVNDPDILLADEPTGALDTATSLQVMGLLKEVAKDKLVVMVTHNPELAEQYATRIVKVQDGRMISDSDPYLTDYNSLPDSACENMGKAFMRLPTAISLSFNNLLTKKARTILTALAGSIGIIGIALILSLSTGVNVYIAEIEEETLSGYPLEISSSGFDFTSLLASSSRIGGGGGDRSDDEIGIFSVISSMFSTVEANDLGALKEYLDSGESGMEPYINAIEYEYDASPQIYLEYEDGSYRQVNPDSSFRSLGLGSGASASSMISSFISTDVFYELPESEELYIDEYDLRAGRWPENYNEVVLVLSSSGGISDFLLYSMGLRDAQELDDMIQSFIDGENIETPDDIGTYTFDDVLGITFKLVNASDYYEYDETYGIWKDKTDNTQYMKDLVADGEDLTIVGIVQPKAGEAILMLSSGLYYEPSLIEHIAGIAAESEIVQQQLADPSVNVFTGEPFGTETDENSFDMTSFFTIDENALERAFTFDPISAMMDIDEEAFMDAFEINMDTDDLTELILSMSTSATATYAGNLSGFGYVDFDTPGGISIYPIDFPSKDYVVEILDDYNQRMIDEGTPEKAITYTDTVGALMSSVTDIVNIISYVLIAFVAISLVVSSIMIGVITYISVLERQKEIGILRSIGASKGNISEVFNAETGIVGFCAGVLGVGIAWLLTIPGDAIIRHFSGTDQVKMVLMPQYAAILVLLSILLTLIGGLIPSRKAAKSDPVIALRTE